MFDKEIFGEAMGRIKNEMRGRAGKKLLEPSVVIEIRSGKGGAEGAEPSAEEEAKGEEMAEADDAIESAGGDPEADLDGAEEDDEGDLADMLDKILLKESQKKK